MKSNLQLNPYTSTAHSRGLSWFFHLYLLLVAMVTVGTQEAKADTKVNEATATYRIFVREGGTNPYMWVWNNGNYSGGNWNSKPQMDDSQIWDGWYVYGYNPSSQDQTTIKIIMNGSTGQTGDGDAEHTNQKNLVFDSYSGGNTFPTDLTSSSTVYTIYSVNDGGTLDKALAGNIVTTSDGTPKAFTLNPTSDTKIKLVINGTEYGLSAADTYSSTSTGPFIFSSTKSETLTLPSTYSYTLNVTKSGNDYSVSITAEPKFSITSSDGSTIYASGKVGETLDYTFTGSTATDIKVMIGSQSLYVADVTAYSFGTTSYNVNDTESGTLSLPGNNTRYTFSIAENTTDGGYDLTINATPTIELVEVDDGGTASNPQTPTDGKISFSPSSDAKYQLRIAGELYGLDSDETFDAANSPYTFGKGKTGRLTLPSGSSYTITPSADGTAIIEAVVPVTIVSNGSTLFSGYTGDSYAIDNTNDTPVSFTVSGATYGLKDGAKTDGGVGETTYDIVEVTSGDPNLLTLPSTAKYVVTVLDKNQVKVVATPYVTMLGGEVALKSRVAVGETMTYTPKSSTPVTFKIGSKTYGLAAATDYADFTNNSALQESTNALTLPATNIFNITVNSDGSGGYTLDVTASERKTIPPVYLIGENFGGWGSSANNWSGTRDYPFTDNGDGTASITTNIASGWWRIIINNGSNDSEHFRATSTPDASTGAEVSMEQSKDSRQGISNASYSYYTYTVKFNDAGTTPQTISVKGYNNSALEIKSGSTSLSGSNDYSTSYSYSTGSDDASYNFYINGVEWKPATDIVISEDISTAQSYPLSTTGEGSFTIHDSFTGTLTLNADGTVSVTAKADFYNASGDNGLLGYNWENLGESTHNKFTGLGNGKYELKLKGVLLNPSSSYHYKIQKNGKWDNDFTRPGSGESDYFTVSTSSSIVSGDYKTLQLNASYDVTITFDLKAGKSNCSTVSTALAPPERLYFNSNIGGNDNWDNISSSDVLVETGVDGTKHTYTYNLDMYGRETVSDVSFVLSIDMNRNGGVGSKTSNSTGTVLELGTTYTEANGEWKTKDILVGGNYNYKFNTNSTEYDNYNIVAVYDESDYSWTVSVIPGVKRPLYTLTYGSQETEKESSKANRANRVSFTIPLDKYNETPEGLSFTITKTEYNADGSVSGTKYMHGTTSTISIDSPIRLDESEDESELTTVVMNAVDKDDDKPASSIRVFLNVDPDLDATETNTSLYYITQAENIPLARFLVIRKKGGEWHYVRMTNTRNRDYEYDSFVDNGKPNTEYRVGDEKIENTVFQNTNLKYDDMAKLFIDEGGLEDEEEMQWFVMSGGETHFFVPAGSNKDASSMTAFTGGDGNFSKYYYDQCDSVGDAYIGMEPDHYYTFNFHKDGAVSYTFGINRRYTSKVNSHNQEPRVVFAYNTAIYSKYQGGYFLIGNFDNGDPGTKIISNDQSHPMTRYMYKDGQRYAYGTTATNSESQNTDGTEFVYNYLDEDGNMQTDHSPSVTNNAWSRYLNNHPDAEPDSIVFISHVTKPVLNGMTQPWRGLYIAVIRANDSKNSSKWDDAWNTGWALRPQINLDNTYDGSNYGYDIDAIATSGGLTTANKQQSINPDMSALAKNMGLAGSDSIRSYDFSINVTTSTYRLNINPAVESDLQLRDYGYHVYRRSNGTHQNRYVFGREVETKNAANEVTGKKKYRFFATWYAPDPYALKKVTGTDKTSELTDSIDAFVVQDIKSEDGLAQVTLRQIVLPRIDKSNSAYTNEPDSIDGLRILYGDTPMLLAYHHWSDDDEDDIPQNSVYKKENVNGYNTLSFGLNPMNTFWTYSGRRDEMFHGVTKPQALTQAIFYYDDDGKNIVSGGYRYLWGMFGHWYWSDTEYGTVKNRDKEDCQNFDLGFWISNGNGLTYANSCYLEIPFDSVSKYHIGVNYEFKPRTTSSHAKAHYAKRRANTPTSKIEEVPGSIVNWMLLPDDGKKGSVTGISDVNKDMNPSVKDDETWYTLQGIRLSGRPSQSGIYIHNGRKVIVK